MELEFNPPKHIELAIEILNSSGHKAYIVGGAVRDLLLGKIPQDYDLATDAKIDEICILFSEFHQINKNGIKHGTITVRINHQNIEISTFRGATIEDDLEHRDLTINSLAFSRDGIIDTRGGIKDLNSKTISMGKDPKRIIDEDPLRILRALRFHASLGYQIEPMTASIMNENASLLENVSKERILSELRTIMLAEDIDYILTEFRNIFGVLFPDLVPCFDYDQHNTWHNHDLYTHIVHVVKGVPPIFVLRMAALFHDIGKVPTTTIEDKGNGTYVKHFYGHPHVSMEMTKPVLIDYRFPIIEQQRVLFLIECHDNEISLTTKSVKKVLAKICDFDGEPLILLEMLLDLQVSDHNDHATITPIHKLETLEIAKRIIEEKDAFRVRDLAVKGQDMQRLGLKGPTIGETLRALLELVIAGSIPNEYDELIKQAKAIIENR